jgi:hypothetical protein
MLDDPSTFKGIVDSTLKVVMLFEELYLSNINNLHLP